MTRVFSILVPQADRSTNTSGTGSTHICLWMQYERIGILISVVLEVFIPGLHPLWQLQLDPEMDTLVPTSTITTLVLVLHTPFNSNSGTIPSQQRETMMIMSTHTPRIFGGFTRCPVIFVVDIVLQNAGRVVDISRKLLTVDDMDRNCSYQFY